MLRTLPTRHPIQFLPTLALLTLAALAVPSCARPQEEDEAWVTPPPAAPQRYAYEDPRTAVWQVFEGDGEFRPLVQPVPGGLIEWTSGTIVGEGRGVARGTTPQDGLMARRAARILAARNALLATGGIAVGPGGSFQNVSGGTIRLDAVIRDFQEIRSEFDPVARTATVAVRIPMYGARGAIRIAGLNLRTVAPAWDWPDAAGPPEALTVVVDLRGTGYTPVLLPRFLTPKGQCIFDAAQLGEEELSWRPAVTHVTYAGLGAQGEIRLDYIAPDLSVDKVGDRAFAWYAARSFKRPLVLGGCRIRPNQPGSIYLSEATVSYLRAHPQTRQLFLAGKVVLVVDGSVPSNRTP